MKKRQFFATLLTAVTLLAGCSVLDEKQRAWIFQPSDRTWSGGALAAQGMQDVWIDFEAQHTTRDRPESRLHGLWLPVEDTGPYPQLPQAQQVQPGQALQMSKVSEVIQTSQGSKAAPPAGAGKTNGPILLYLHGARYNVTGSAPRMRRMQELGFSVLAIDYRGFGKSTNELPSEATAYEDARAAWDWLAQKYPNRPRYIFGHSLGGPIAINLATEVDDEAGTIVEGTFTSIADVVSSSEWGWLPVSLLITQRFEAVRKVGKIGSPLLVVHGGEDHTILPDLGKKLYDAAAAPKLFMLVEGGSHHDTNQVGQPQYRQALTQLFGMK